MKFDLLKDWRVLMLIFFIVASIIAVAPSGGTGGVAVKSVPSDSPLYGKLTSGEVITWVNEQQISTPEDMYAFDNFTGVLRFMVGGKLRLAEITSPGLRITVAKKPTNNINFGMDIVGGTRVLLKPIGNVSDDLIQQAIATLETRINIYGLREARFQSVNDVSGNKYITIEMAGGDRKSTRLNSSHDV